MAVLVAASQASAVGLAPEASDTPSMAAEAGDSLPGSTEVEDAGEPVEGWMGWLYTTREGVYDAAHWVVRGVDGWFGDKPFEEEGGRVSGSVFVSTLYREDDGFDAGIRFRLRVHMPNINDRVYLFVGRESEQELVTDQQATFTRSQQLLPDDSDDDTFFAGIGYFLRDNVTLRAGVRGGYRVFVQARWREDWWMTDRSNLALSQTVFAAVRDGVGLTTGVNYSYVIRDDRVFRWRNSGTFSTETEGVRWGTAMGVVQRLPRSQEVSLDLLANGETDARVPVREYGVRGIYSRPLYRDWLRGELVLGYFWPRDDDDPQRRESWATGINLEMSF